MDNSYYKCLTPDIAADSTISTDVSMTWTKENTKNIIAAI